MTSLVLVLVALAGTPAPGVLQDGHEERFAAFFRDATGPRGGLRGWTVDAITLGPECRAVVSLRTPHGHPVRAAMSPSLEGGLTMEFLGDPSPENQGALLPGLPEGDLAALFAEACAPRPPTHLWDEARGLDPGDAGEPLPPAPVPGTRGLAAAGLLAFLAFLAALRARGKELRRFLAGTSAVERLTLGALGLGAALRLVVLLRTEILPPELVFYLPRAGQAPAGHEGGFPAALLEGRVLFLLLREPWALLGDHLGVGGGTTWLRLPGPAAWLLLAGAVAALGRRLAAPRAALATVLALALMPHPGLLGTPLRPELLEAALVAWTLERLAAGPAAGRSLLAVVSAAAWSGPLGAVFGLCALAAHGVRGAQPGGSPPPTAGLLLALAVMTPPLLAALAPMTPEAPAPWPLDGSFREALEYLRSQRALDVGWNPLALAGAAFDPAGGGVSALAGLLLVPGLLLLAALRPGEGLVLLGGLGLAWARAMAAPLHPTAFLPLAAPLLFGAL
ncbi:MAG: hypothetical protein FJ098_00815, partial [Deltaproteobacteria bacterium]|nr:hypothetical protein [Deltaproteobacteria bacterium]